ncbi:hypothetical protein L6164_017972 [Bauhinia variegata]|uniref:Uncharacterized protein n=1 Tax=Bauhinia variegata TaxID=167791 RepID=A0ACB9NBG5_BAUVA|nr:hypothetical protein L6164_017972 [Bauhinia variegata]
MECQRMKEGYVLRGQSLLVEKSDIVVVTSLCVDYEPWAWNSAFILDPLNLGEEKTSVAGFAGLREGASFRACDVTNGQSTASTSRLNGHMNFSSCSGRMPQIAENGNESMESSCVDSRNLGNDNGSSKCFMPSFTSDFWKSSAFNGQKTASDNDEIMFSTSGALETQDSDFGFQNRVRRTRISERIQKLHDFFPKSDKQTSTADMLDLAVDYIKELQNQVKMLTETKAKCPCSSLKSRL